MAKKIFIFGLIFAATILLYWQVFRVYFVGDDFFHFKISGNLFGLHPVSAGGYAFYRPFFREVTYNLVYRFWGLNQIPLRIFSFFLHFSNVVLVYILFKRIFKNFKIATLTSFFFALSAANAGTLYYLAGGLQAQGATLFILLTLILFPKHKVLAILTFLLSLMSHELAIVTPLLIAGLMFTEGKFKLKDLLPYIFISAFYLYIDFAVIGFSKSEIQYRPELNPKTFFNSLFWYSLWALGLPETLIDFVNPRFVLNPNLMRYWGNLYMIIFPAFFISAGLLVLIIFLQRKRVFREKKLLFLIFWFVVGLLPVLVLPLHKSTYYLALSLPAFWGIVTYTLLGKGNLERTLSVIFMISWGVLTIYSIKVMDLTYWAAQRGRISQKLTADIKNLYPVLPRGAVIYVKNDPNYPFIAKDWGGTSKQASLILSGSDAIDLLYKDNSIKVYYEDLGKPPQGTFYPFVAKIQ